MNGLRDNDLDLQSRIDELRYVALSSATQEAVWLRRLATELGESPKEPTMIFEDNQSTVIKSK